MVFANLLYFARSADRTSFTNLSFTAPAAKFSACHPKAAAFVFVSRVFAPAPDSEP
jgi:hypothetical protein